MADDPTLVSLYKKDETTKPGALSIKPYGANEVYLEWAPASSNLVFSYNVYQAYNRELIFNKIAITSGINYIVSGLNNANNYHFAVSSNYYDSYSGFISNQLIDTFGHIRFGYDFIGPVTQPPLIPNTGSEDPLVSGLIPPINIIVTQMPTPSGYYGLVLNWNAPSGIQVSGYRVWRATTWDSSLSSIGSTRNTRYIDSGLNENQAYHYAVSSLV
jgi:hypothetical protein